MPVTGTRLSVGQMEVGTFEPVEYLSVYCGQLVTTECTAMRELNAVPDMNDKIRLLETAPIPGTDCISSSYFFSSSAFS